MAAHLDFSPVPRANPQDDYSFIGGGGGGTAVSLSNYNSNNNNTTTSLRQQYEEKRQERRNNSNTKNLQPETNKNQQQRHHNRSLSPIRERANLTTDAFSSTLEDIDRRTLRSQSYITKKFDHADRNRSEKQEKEIQQQHTRFHRVARELPSYENANQTFSYYATHNEDGTPKKAYGMNNNNNNNQNGARTQNNNNNNNTFSSGMKLKEIQEEITRRSLQTEKAMIQSHDQHHQKQQQRPMSPSSHRYQTMDQEQSSALRKRLDNARRNTEQSVKSLLGAAINLLVRRENDERLKIGTEETQQFARLTAHKALQYANVINNPSTYFSKKKQPLEPIQQQPDVDTTKEQQQQQQRYDDDDHEQQSTPSQLQKFLMMSGYKNRNNANNNNSNNDENDVTAPTIVEEEKTVTRRRELQQEQDEDRHQTSNAAPSTSTSSYQTKSSAVVPQQEFFAKQQERVVYVEDQAMKNDNQTLRKLFVSETLFKEELSARQEISNDAFDSALNIALRMSMEKPSSNNNIVSSSPSRFSRPPSSTRGGSPTSNNSKRPASAKEDKQILTTMFVTENLARREFEIRQEISSEAFDSILTVMAMFVNLAPKDSTSASPSSSDKAEKELRKMADLLQRDKSALREMFIMEHLQHREAQTRVSLLLEALNDTASTFAVPSSELMMNAATENSKTSASHSANENEKSNRTNNDNSVLKSMFVYENLEHREARRRQEILLEALIDYSFIVNVVANGFTSLANAATSSAKETPSTNNNNDAANKALLKRANDERVVRGMFIVENFEHRESQARQRLLLEALTETFVVFQRFSSSLPSSTSANNTSTSKIIEVPKTHPDLSAAELHAQIMLESIVLRESEQRNTIESECWRSYLLLHQYHDQFLVRNLKQHESQWSFEKQQERALASTSSASTQKGRKQRSYEEVQQDLLFVKGLFVLEGLQRREAERRAKISEEAFLFNINSFGWRVPFDVAAYSVSPSRSRNRQLQQEEEEQQNISSSSNTNVNNNKLSERAKKDIEVLRMTVLEEHCFRREADMRAKIQEQSLLEKIEIVRAFEQGKKNHSLLNDFVNNNKSRPVSAFSNKSGASTTASQREIENTQIMRVMFIHENMFHREMDLRASIIDEESAMRLQQILAFYATAMSLVSSSSSTNVVASSSLPPRPTSAYSRTSARSSRPSSAAQDARFLRELYVIENFLKKETEIRHAVEQEQFLQRLDISTLLQQDLILLNPSSPVRNLNSTSTSSSSPAAAAMARDRKLLKEMFIVENLEHRETTARSDIKEEMLRGLMFILFASNNFFATSASASASSVSSPNTADPKTIAAQVGSSNSIDDRQQNNQSSMESQKQISELQFFREEARARVAIQNEESTCAIDLAIQSRPLKQLIKGRIRALKDISVLRQMFISEQVIRKEAEVRAEFALQAALGGSTMFSKMMADVAKDHSSSVLLKVENVGAPAAFVAAPVQDDEDIEEL